MRRSVSSSSPFEHRYGFSRAIRTGDRVLVAGTAPVPPPGEPVAATAHEQMLRCGAIAIEALTQLGATVEDVVRTRMFITDAASADEVGEAHRLVFGSAMPTATMVVVAALLDPLWLVEIEVEAVLPGQTGRPGLSG